MLIGLSYFYYPQLFPNIFEIKHVKVVDSQNLKDPSMKGHAPYKPMSDNFDKS